MPSPDTPWDDRVRFAADSAGRYFTYRPDEMIVHVDGLADLADPVGDDLPGAFAQGQVEVQADADQEPPDHERWPDLESEQPGDEEAQTEGATRTPQEMARQQVARRVDEAVARQWPFRVERVVGPFVQVIGVE